MGFAARAAGADRDRRDVEGERNVGIGGSAVEMGANAEMGVDGRVGATVVESGEAVEYGQELVRLDTANVDGQTETMRTSGYANVSADQADPVGGNDVAGTATLVPSSSGGCSTGGAIGPMALLGLMLVLSRKRRTA